MPTKAIKKSDTKVDIKELLKAGAHFGHKVSHWNPKTEPYVHSQRGDIYIIDLIKTADLLKTALDFVVATAGSGKKILFVGTKRHVRETVAEAAKSADQPYVTQRWFGGILTNFPTIHRRIKHLIKLEEQLASGELSETYNKREIGEFEEEAAKLNQQFAGIKAMDELPGAVFVASVHNNQIAVREASRLKIPVVGIVDTNADPTNVDYVIPANDDAVSTIELIGQLVAKAARQGAATTKTTKAAQADEPAPAKPKEKR